MCRAPFPSRAVPTKAAPAALSTNYYSTSFLTTAAPLNLALVILNVKHRASEFEKHGPAARFAHVWEQSSLRICADGAANRLYDSLDEDARSRMLPDLITGDLDSLRGDVATFYSDRGVPIEGEAEQDSHDFEKCLRWLERRQRDDAARSSSSTGSDGTATPVQPFSVVAVGAFGGRLDQQMANLNMAYSYACFERFYLVSDASLAFVLPPGKHVIDTNLEAEDGSCGLIPLGGRCERVVTTGCVPRAHTQRTHTRCTRRPASFGLSQRVRVRLMPACACVQSFVRACAALADTRPRPPVRLMLARRLKWNLDGKRPLEFGSLISSSNEIADARVTVETSEPLLWTTGLREW